MIHGQQPFSLPVLNGLRIALITLACISMVLMAMRAHRARVNSGDHFAVFATSALIVAMLFVVVVEVQQIGHPLATWWGLPMLAAIVLLTLAALWRSKV